MTSFLNSGRRMKTLLWSCVLNICILIYSSMVKGEDICKSCACAHTHVSCENTLLSSNAENALTKTLVIKGCNVTSFFQTQLKFPSLRELHVRDSTLQDVNEKAFVLLSNLIILELSNSSIRQLSTGTLSHNCKLTTLDFSDNGIFSIPKTLFSCASTLRTITLRKNNLEELVSGEFVNNYRVKNLDMSQNNIRHMGNGVFNMSGVDRFSLLSSKVVLNVSSNKLGMLRGHVFSLCSQVTILDLSFNILHDVDENAFIGLLSLQILNLQHNRITTMPAKLFNGLTHLREVSLQNNRLRSVSADQFAQVTIKSLRLSKNRIERLDQFAFRGLVGLQELYLEDNVLKELGNSFTVSLPNLSFMNISSNHLSSLKSHMFKGCASLTTLDLSENTISVVEDCVFSGNSRMKELYLQGNSISNLSSCSFMSISSLKTLHLENNSFRELMYSPFNRLEKVENIYFSLDSKFQCECAEFARFKKKSIHLHLTISDLNDNCRKIYESSRTTDNQLIKNCSINENDQDIMDCECSENFHGTNLVGDGHAIVPSATDYSVNRHSTVPPRLIPGSEVIPREPESDYYTLSGANITSKDRAKIQIFPANATSSDLHPVQLFTHPHPTSPSITASQTINFSISHPSPILSHSLSSAEKTSNGSESTVPRFVVYCLVVFAGVVLGGVVALFGYKLYMKCRYSDHLYEPVSPTVPRVTEETVV